MTMNDHDDGGPQTGIWLAAAITDATPAPAPVEAQPAVGRVARWTLTEPVRLYLYALCLVLAGGMQLAGWLTGQWVEYAATSAGVVLGIGAAGEAVRASVYSPAATVRAIRAAVREVGR